MHRLRSALNNGAECFRDGLMPQTHAQQRQMSLCGRLDHRDACAGLCGGSRAGRDHDGVYTADREGSVIDGVGLDESHVCAEFGEVPHQREDEAVVIVDNENGRAVNRWSLPAGA